MKSRMLKLLFVLTLFVGSNIVLTACKTYCPGTDGTGNSASRDTRRSISLGKSECPAIRGTGNYKPKLKNKKEDGLMSPKMQRDMAKAANKKAGPLESKRLHFD